MKAFVYFNLHRKCWSVRALEGAHKGLIVAYADVAVMDGVEFRVSQKGRDRVIREGRKNVHAGAVGNLTHLGGHVSLRRRGVYDLSDYGLYHLDLPIDDYVASYGAVRGVEPVGYNPYRHHSGRPASFYSKVDDRDVRSAGAAVLTHKRTVLALQAA